MATPNALQPKLHQLSAQQHAAAVELLAWGMADNPLHKAIFGAEPKRRQRRLKVVLAPLITHIQAHGQLWGLSQHQQLIAVLGVLPPQCCQPRFSQKLALGWQVARQLAPLITYKTARWLLNWAHQDPAFAHWHLGPLTVHPQYRRQGLARQLMHHALAQIDTQAAWLETDLQRNVDFYQQLGFRVQLQTQLFGVNQWFMLRQGQT